MSRAYYNEINPHAAQWLRNLIDAGLIAYGDVDERDIRDINPSDLAGYTQCHFFAGIGVWSYALRMAGWPDDRPVWTGSCPCQPFSAAGRGGGVADERHLWPHWHHLISVCRPPNVFGEQVASKDGLGWLDLVQTDMEGTDYMWGHDGEPIYYVTPHETTGNFKKVSRTDGCRPLMNLPAEFPDNIDYGRYIEEAWDILRQVGALPAANDNDLAPILRAEAGSL